MSDRWITQTILHGGPVMGNCAQACLASMLGVPLHSVPHFAQEYGERWLHYADRWARKEHGMMLLRILDPAFGALKGCYHIALGTSPRGVGHAVVMRGSELVHDPHPSREGLVEGSIDECALFVPIDPSQFQRVHVSEELAA